MVWFTGSRNTMDTVHEAGPFVCSSNVLINEIVCSKYSSSHLVLREQMNRIFCYGT